MTSNDFEPPVADDADLPHLSDGQVEALLRGHRPADTAPGTDRAADLVHALTGPAVASELTGYRAAMTTYTDAFSMRTSSRPRRLLLLSSLLGARTLAGVAGSALALGAVGAVVLTTSALGPSHAPEALPLATGSTTTTAASTHAPDDADQSDDADESEKDGTGSGSATAAVGPDAKGPAAFGLCNAWAHHQAEAGTTATADTSVAFRNLAEAAGGEGKIAGYCANVPHPGNAAAKARGSHGSTPGSGGKGKSTKAPKPAKPTKPTKPHSSSHSASPSARPTARPRTSAPTPSLTTPSRPAVTVTS
ncbi:hypothetical protein [Phycicoccus sp. Soil748]|uniref:hypothetical protein n=1 Tax=Intrasporangiaceae TaxID=85021 RepID=UPI0007034428|nr:hypothetical protein [Phycicoccus sp. Soil748]KRE58977.1 hypothetical protein ASG70_17290 [Phycicoccus sp. Soil748]